VSIRWLLLTLTACLLAMILVTGFWMSRQTFIEEMETLSKQQLSLLAESIRTHITSMMESGADDQMLDAQIIAFNQRWQGKLDLRLLHGSAVDRQFGAGEQFDPGIVETFLQCDLKS